MTDSKQHSAQDFEDTQAGDRDEFLRGVIEKLRPDNRRWPGLWTRLSSLMAERDSLVEQLEALRDTLAAVMVFVPESGATIRAGYGKAAREARELLASNPASEPKP